MSIVQLPYPYVGQSGLIPDQRPLVTTDNLATVTAPGYLNSVNLEGFPLNNNSVLHVLYSYNQQTNSGTFGIFTVNISNGVISLTEWINPGDVLLPVVSGNIPKFNGALGQISDSGISPSNAAKTKMVMANGAVTVGHIGVFTDVNGTLGQDAATAINLGNIQAGNDSVKGQLIAYGGSSNGHLILNPIGNTGNTAITIQNAIFGQASVLTIPDPGTASANFVLDNVPSGQILSSSTSSATPGTVRALTGSMNETNSVMTSGNVVGVRGVVNCVGASGGFIYGTQGKVIATGTLSGSLWAPAVFGQYDLSAATLSGAQLAPLWGDYGATAPAGTYPALSGIKLTNTTAAILGSQISLFGGATNLLSLDENIGGVGATYAASAGAGSIGANPVKLKISLNGVTKYLICADDWT